MVMVKENAMLASQERDPLNWSVYLSLVPFLVGFSAKISKLGIASNRTDWPDARAPSCMGCYIAFHSAGAIPIWGRYNRTNERTNDDGDPTREVQNIEENQTTESHTSSNHDWSTGDGMVENVATMFAQPANQQILLASVLNFQNNYRGAQHATQRDENPRERMCFPLDTRNSDDPLYWKT